MAAVPWTVQKGLITRGWLDFGQRHTRSDDSPGPSQFQGGGGRLLGRRYRFQDTTILGVGRRRVSASENMLHSRVNGGTR